MASIAMPTWLRIFVAGAVVLVTGAGLFGYRWYTRPTTLTIAVGSLDGEAPKLMSALASRLAAANAPVRLKLVETTSALEAAEMFSSNKTDLAVVRGDVGDLSQAQAVVILAHAVVLLVAPPGSSITDIAGLKRVTVGVVGGETNRKVVSALTEEYDLGRANVTFRNLAPAETRRALEAKEVRAILVVVPLAEKYLALLRGLFPQNPKSAPVLIPIEAAGAIAEKQRAYESFDVPKGTLRGSPAGPERRPDHAQGFILCGCQEAARQRSGRRIDGSVDEGAQGPARRIADAGADDRAEHRLRMRICRFIPALPPSTTARRRAFWTNGETRSSWRPMIFGGIVSVLAAAWKFLRDGEPRKSEQALDLLYALGRRIRTAEARVGPV